MYYIDLDEKVIVVNLKSMFNLIIYTEKKNCLKSNMLITILGNILYENIFKISLKIKINKYINSAFLIKMKTGWVEVRVVHVRLNGR